MLEEAGVTEQWPWSQAWGWVLAPASYQPCGLGIPLWPGIPGSSLWPCEDWLHSWGGGIIPLLAVTMQVSAGAFPSQLSEGACAPPSPGPLREMTADCPLVQPSRLHVILRGSSSLLPQYLFICLLMPEDLFKQGGSF